jgi:hypothetical protein
MAFVPGVANDVFISYSHIDNQAPAGGVGWVTDFHQRLRIELEEELGARIQIWRDPRIGTADDFARDLDRQVRDSAVLLPVLSPGYRGSAWCEREAREFVTGTLRTGDLWVDTKCRLIKVSKRPADVNLVPETGSCMFFETDAESGHVYELDGGSEKYNRLLTKVAHEIALVLSALRKARSVFLGTASDEQAEQRERIKRELEARAYRVLTTRADDALEIVHAAVRECSLSVLFAGVSTAPDDNGAARATDERTVASAEGARQVVVTHPHHDFGKIGENPNVEWLIDPPPHTLNHTVLEMLKRPDESGGTQRLVRVYLICDRADHPLLEANRARKLRDHLLQLGFEVKTPLAEDSEAAEFSRDNRSKLKQCDGVLLYWGTARQSWFEERLRELLQARGWRRGRNFSAAAAFVSDPENPVKLNYETRELDELIKQFKVLDLNDTRLTRFVERLSGPA